MKSNLLQYAVKNATSVTPKSHIIYTPVPTLARVQTPFSADRACIGPLPAHCLPIVSPVSSYRSQHQDVTISAEQVRRAAEPGRDGGRHWTVTTEGQHWVKDATKNNYHYSCQQKALQARSYQP